jgi:hypothetical protein
LPKIRGRGGLVINGDISEPMRSAPKFRISKGSKEAIFLLAAVFIRKNEKLKTL